MWDIFFANTQHLSFMWCYILYTCVVCLSWSMIFLKKLLQLQRTEILEWAWLHIKVKICYFYTQFFCVQRHTLIGKSSLFKTTWLVLSFISLTSDKLNTSIFRIFKDRGLVKTIQKVKSWIKILSSN